MNKVVFLFLWINIVWSGFCIFIFLGIYINILLFNNVVFNVVKWCLFILILFFMKYFLIRLLCFLVVVWIFVKIIFWDFSFFVNVEYVVVWLCWIYRFLIVFVLINVLIISGSLFIDEIVFVCEVCLLKVVKFYFEMFVLSGFGSVRFFVFVRVCKWRFNS